MSPTEKSTPWKLTKLHSHPRQAELFPDLSDAKLEELAEDMRINKQQQPVEITSDGTIIAGHQRVRAARKLGWKTITVIIRDDLEKQGPDAVELRLIDDNSHRRQLDLLSEVRCIVARHALYKPDPDPAKWQPPPRTLDVICERLNMSPKNAKRYLSVLETPMAVQNAYSRGELTLVLAARVSLLPSEIQAEIANQITTEENATLVAQSYMAKSCQRHVSPREKNRTFLKQLSPFLESIPESWDELSVYDATDTNAKTVSQIIAKLQKYYRQQKSALKRRPPPDPEPIAFFQAQSPGDDL